MVIGQRKIKVGFGLGDGILKHTRVYLVLHLGPPNIFSKWEEQKILRSFGHFFFIFCKRGLPNIELIVGLEEETTETNGYYVSIFLRFSKLLLQERLRLEFF